MLTLTTDRETIDLIRGSLWAIIALELLIWMAATSDLLPIAAA